MTSCTHEYPALWPSTDICNYNGYCSPVTGKCVCNVNWTGDGDLLSFPFNDCYIFQPIISALWAMCCVSFMSASYYSFRYNYII